jgi:hypothetical protein
MTARCASELPYERQVLRVLAGAHAADRLMTVHGPDVATTEIAQLVPKVIQLQSTAGCAPTGSRRPGFTYIETKPTLWQAGHLANRGSSSSNHERPHSQRNLNTCCTVIVPHSCSWTSIPLAVGSRGGVRRPGGGNLPGWVVR